MSDALYMIEDINKEDLREIILETVSDLVADFLFYGRKGDEDPLKLGYIEKAIEYNIITIDEIVNHFRRVLEDNL